VRRLDLVPAALAACALGAAACAWSVPADPGENSRVRARPATAVAARPRDARTLSPGRVGDPGAAAVYERKCGECHAPFPPTHATAAEWPTYVRRYGPRAGLFGAERARVLSWLQANAR
jgi:hypothetical protein